MRSAGILLLALICLAGSASISSAGDYPERPIQLIVGFQAGGSADIMSRVLAKQMGEAFGLPIVVVNKPGGGGTVGAAFVKNAVPDGYTVGVTIDTPFSFAPYSGASLSYVPEDFNYLGILGQFQTAYVTLSSSPYNTFKDIIAAAKEGKEFRYGSQSSEDKLPMMAFAKKNDLKFMPVPMKGGADIMTAVLGGHVDFGYSGGIHYSYVKANKMKILGAAGAERLEDFPDVPTMLEQGLPIDCTVKFIAFVPKGVPADIAKKLVDAFKKAASSQEYTDLLKNNLHVKVEYGDSAAAQQYIDARKKYYVDLNL